MVTEKSKDINVDVKRSVVAEFVCVVIKDASVLNEISGSCRNKDEVNLS
jgi:hypothetical protein